MLCIALRQASSQLRQVSAQMRQWSCIAAWVSHSSAHRRQAVAQASSIARITASLEPLRRVATAPSGGAQF